MDNSLSEKWDMVISEADAPVVSNKEGMARLLENEAAYLAETGSVAGDIAQYSPILIPAVRRIFPNLMANELVSVQPMSMPTGYAYALRYGYGGTDGENFAGVTNANKDLGTNSQFGLGTIKTPTFGTFAVLASVPAFNFGVSGSSVVLASAGVTGVVQYSEAGRALITITGGTPNLLTPGSTGVAAAGDGAFTAVALFNNEAGYNLIFKNFIQRNDTATGEGLKANADMRTMKMSVERIQIQAETRKMKAEYTVELAQDLKNVHGLDAEAELINILEYEIGAELDRTLVDLINQKATKTATWSYGVAGAQGSTLTAGYAAADGRWEAEKIRTLYTRILSEANKVALTTRRGTANIIIASSNVVSALESLQGFMYASVPGTVKPTLGIAKVGTLDGRFTVYLDTFATSDYVTVMYKGTSALDSGIIYCPYIPLMMQKVVDPNTFQNRIGFMVRDAITGNLWGTANYQRYIPVDFTGSALGGAGLWAA